MQGTEMTDFLGTLGSIVTKMIEWTGSVGGAILNDPILTFSLSS